MRKYVILVLLALLLPSCAAVAASVILATSISQERAEIKARERMRREWAERGMTDAEIIAKIRSDEPEWWAAMEARRLREERKAAAEARFDRRPRYVKQPK